MTTDRRAALVALKDAVVVGDDAAFRRANRAVFSTPCQDMTAQMCVRNAYYAYKGSMNDALALLGAVLPGWGMGIIGPMSSGEYHATVLPRQDDPPEYHGNAPTPARALLLATLSALIEQEAQP